MSRLWVQWLMVGLVSGCGWTTEDGATDVDDGTTLSAPAARTRTKMHDLGEKPRHGKWRRVRESERLTEEQRSEIAQLEAIGYVSGSVERTSTTVITRYDPNQAADGINLYVSGHAAEATLIDMRGRELHRWTSTFHDIWPDHPARPGSPGTHHFRRAKVTDNGDLIAIYEGKGIVRLDNASRVVWALDNRAHHDLDFLPNGDIVTLTRTAHLVPQLNGKKPVLEDFLVVISPDGNERRRVSLMKALDQSDFSQFWRREGPVKGDIFHTNTVHVLGPGLEHVHPAFQAGRILTSSRALNLIFVVDLDLETVVWALRDGFKKQHDPRIVAGTHLLVFDNVGAKRGARVLEYDLATMRPVWTYRGTDNEPFLSKTLGTAHRLDNGNTLITESEGGRAFEVTREGEVVWEFFNPHRAGDSDEFIAALFEVTRLPRDFGESWRSVVQD